MASKIFSRSMRIVSLLLVAAALAAFGLSTVLKDIDHYTRMALQHFEESSGYRLTFSRVAVHAVRGAGLRIDDFILSHPESGRELLRGEHLYIHISLRRLLKKKFTIRQLQVEKPRIQVYRDTDGTWHSFLSVLAQADEASGSPLGNYRLFVYNIVLNGGVLVIHDTLHASTVRLHDCDISLHREERSVFYLQMQAEHNAEGSRGTVRYTSEFHRSLFRRRGPDPGLSKLMSARLEFSNLPVRECLSYLPERFSVPVDEGLLDADFSFEILRDKKVSARGECRLKSPRIAGAGLKPVILPDVRFSFRAASDNGVIACEKFAVAVDPWLRLSGTAAAERRGADASVLDVRFGSGQLDALALARSLASAGSQGGRWLHELCERLQSASITVHDLEGSVPLGAAFSAAAVSLKGRLGIAFVVGAAAPSGANDLSIELDNGRLRCSGKVSLLPGDSHSIDFNARIRDGSPRIDGTVVSRLVPGGISALRDMLSRGTRSTGVELQEGSVAIRTRVLFEKGLSAVVDIDAKDAAWDVAGAVGKARGVANTVRFAYDGSKDSRSATFDFRIGDTLRSKGDVLFGDKIGVSGNFNARDFSLMQCVFPFLPESLRLRGRVSGSGIFVFPTTRTGLLPASGSLRLEGVALCERDDGRPLIRADAQLDSPASPGPLRVSGGRVEAGNTRGAFEGQLTSMLPPVGTFTAPMEAYDIDDFIGIMIDIARSFRQEDDERDERPESGDTESLFARTDIRVDLTSEQTQYLDWHFGPGRSDFSVKKKRLLWDAIDIEGGNGTVSGSVLYDLSGTDSYALEFVIDRSDVDVDWAIPAFREHQTMTGRLSLESRFSSRFKRGRDVLKNMEGTFDYVVRDGKIQRLTLLSNILNMLNVARLFTLRMPEFSAHGMPFDTMAGSFALKDMQLSTEDLMLACPSMDFSVAGTFDLAEQELDLLVGVQVFRTFARILGSVPLLGSMLTGKGKTLTLTYFRARGPFAEPRIWPVPTRVIDNAIRKVFKSVRTVPQDLTQLPMGMIRRFAEQEGDNQTGP